MPILSEKPIADTWAACLEIYRAVTGAGLRMQVVQNYRYTPRIMTLKAALTGGRIGRPNGSRRNAGMTLRRVILSMYASG